MERIINNLDDLVVPKKHKEFLEIFLSNIKNIKSVQKVILFGSCARGEATSKSDIDLLVIGSHITKADEVSIIFDCPPMVDHPAYLGSDILIGTATQYEKNIDEWGMIQKQIYKEGVDLYGLI